MPIWAARRCAGVICGPRRRRRGAAWRRLFSAVATADLPSELPSTARPATAPRRRGRLSSRRQCYWRSDLRLERPRPARRPRRRRGSAFMAGGRYAEPAAAAAVARLLSARTGALAEASVRSLGAVLATWLVLQLCRRAGRLQAAPGRPALLAGAIGLRRRRVGGARGGNIGQRQRLRAAGLAGCRDGTRPIGRQHFPGQLAAGLSPGLGFKRLDGGRGAPAERAHLAVPSKSFSAASFFCSAMTSCVADGISTPAHCRRCRSSRCRWQSAGAGASREPPASPSASARCASRRKEQWRRMAAGLKIQRIAAGQERKAGDRRDDRLMAIGARMNCARHPVADNRSGDHAQYTPRATEAARVHHLPTIGRRDSVAAVILRFFFARAMGLRLCRSLSRRSGRHRASFRHFGFRTVYGQQNRHRRAAAGLRGNAQFALVQVDQALDDGKAEPRALVAPRQAVLRLEERLADPRDGLGASCRCRCRRPRD